MPWYWWTWGLLAVAFMGYDGWHERSRRALAWTLAGVYGAGLLVALYVTIHRHSH